MLQMPGLGEKPDVCYQYLSYRMRDQAYLRAGKVSEQRDVSPGTLPDGSHAKTASDRGEVYEASKMSKFKNKLGFGRS
jgi:hypothetical protein